MESSSFGALCASVESSCMHSLAFYWKPKETIYLSSPELDSNCLFSLSGFMFLMSSFPLAETQAGKSVFPLSGYLSLKTL